MNKYYIFDSLTDELLHTVFEKNIEHAEQEASCYVAETGLDREYDYNGIYVVDANEYELQEEINERD